MYKRINKHNKYWEIYLIERQVEGDFIEISDMDKNTRVMWKSAKRPLYSDIVGLPLLEATAQQSWGDALELSIKKWEMIVRLIKKYNLPVYDGGRDTCGLCIRENYLNWDYEADHPRALSCQFCPIFAKTKIRACDSTPYENYHKWIRDGLEASGYLKDQFIKILLVYAKREVSFLKGLRDDVVRFDR